MSRCVYLLCSLNKIHDVDEEVSNKSERQQQKKHIRLQFYPEVYSANSGLCTI